MNVRHPSTTLFAVAAATAAALSATGCGQPADDTTPAVTTSATETAAAPTAEPDEPDDDTASEEAVLTAYFDGFTAGGEQGAEQMAAHAAPGSPAALYAGYWGASGQALSQDESTARVEDGAVTVTSTADDGTRETTTYRDFEFDAGGLITTWSTDPGGPLAPRITAVDQAVQRDGLTVEFSYAYESNSGTLVLPVKVANERAEVGKVTVYTYIQPSGQQLEGRTAGVTTVPFFVEVEPGAFLFDMLYVEAGKLGGTALFEFDNDVPNPERVQVPTAASAA